MCNCVPLRVSLCPALFLCFRWQAFFDGGGEGLGSSTADEVAKPLPALFELFEEATGELTVIMATLYSQAYAADESTVNWRGPTGLSYNHIKGILQFRAEHLKDAEAAAEVERTKSWA